MSKKTVSLRPCNTTSHSNFDGKLAERFAISVDRRAGSTCKSAKSVAFAGSSEK